MSEVPSASFFSWPPRGEAAEPDAADLGTAFGLDLSLLPADEAPPGETQPKGWPERLGLPAWI